MTKAIGVHVFAGGFTAGVKKIFDVECQLETHGFGQETCEQVFDTPFVNCASADAWPRIDVPFVYGNPRCTGFSCITSGYSDEVHGPWADACQDIHDLCEYGVRNECDIIIWESVQQAASVGRPLLNYLRDELFVPKGYRIAHLFLNAATFGNAQARKRYFFVAYRDDRNFNITPPRISPYYTTCYDVLWGLRNNTTHEGDLHTRAYNYGFNTFTRLTPDEKHCARNLPNGWSMNVLAKYFPEALTEKQQKTYEYRVSEMPFSIHCIHRLNWLRPYPTIHSSAGRQIHPTFNRPVTVGEIATVMGWEGLIPVGRNPISQIAKGVCPCAGTWLAEQAQAYLDDAWGKEDFESSFNLSTCTWEGASCSSVEKTFNMTQYVGHKFNEDNYESLAPVQDHRFDVATRAKRLKQARAKCH